MYVMYANALSVAGTSHMPVAHLSHKLQCARQSLKIMVSYGNKYPRHNARPHVVEQSGQCARAHCVPYPKQQRWPITPVPEWRGFPTIQKYYKGTAVKRNLTKRKQDTRLDVKECGERLPNRRGIMLSYHCTAGLQAVKRLRII